ncbi:LysR substrate-binding domain-containing protein [Sinomicrobium weinanense]|uniref:LysR family transcriptional regulator n=1 Tax=Sinomicrobium weinanense TaxID=2842200 RepID=A0A926Q2F5_9FLAO|nr:LysR substrate-binding domain-containing protein [Sinomicrobium weinanense]MBC9794861.1 LysR family transcriptional regulator [Sinomicrobium weinanense]MBU3125632.1 LysR family transcriptional regulator [Sinomicrobium weinanense]
MKKNNLYYFCVLADELHFGNAAKKLHITQPPLSRAIQQLEEELECLLLKRDQRNVTLTPAGEYLKQRGDVLLANLSEMKSEVKKIVHGQKGELHITLVGSIIQRLMPYLKRFIRKYPSVKIKISQYTTREQIQLIKSGDADIGFLRGPIFARGLNLYDFYKEPFVLVTPRHFKGTVSKIEDFQQLSNMSYISFPRYLARGLHDQITRICNMAAYYPHVIHEVHQLDLIVRMVECGLGISIIPQCGLDGLLADIRTFKLDFISQQSVISCYFNDLKDNPVLGNFLKELNISKEVHKK